MEQRAKIPGINLKHLFVALEKFGSEKRVLFCNGLGVFQQAWSGKEIGKLGITDR